jgi:hypothetical protein
MEIRSLAPKRRASFFPKRPRGSHQGPDVKLRHPKSVKLRGYLDGYVFRNSCDGQRAKVKAKTMTRWDTSFAVSANFRSCELASALMPLIAN